MAEVIRYYIPEGMKFCERRSDFSGRSVSCYPLNGRCERHKDQAFMCCGRNIWCPKCWEEREREDSK